MQYMTPLTFLTVELPLNDVFNSSTMASRRLNLAERQGYNVSPATGAIGGPPFVIVAATVKDIYQKKT